MPETTNPAETASPYRNPLHTDAMSKAAASAMPSLAATSGAVAGHGRSGVVVASTTMVVSLTDADFSARRPASTARSEVATPRSAICLCRIPVRRRTHSSLVSSVRARSSLVTISGGTHAPSPVRIAARSVLPSRPTATPVSTLSSGRGTLGPYLADLHAYLTEVVRNLPVRLEHRYLGIGQSMGQAELAHDRPGPTQVHSRHARKNVMSDLAARPAEEHVGK